MQVTVCLPEATNSLRFDLTVEQSLPDFAAT
jgi:hypothetical protein